MSSMKRVLLKNPINHKRAWFVLPFYFGQLVKIGLIGSYADQLVVEEVEGIIDFPVGPCLVEDLEALNRQAEGGC